jgi:hypothetical protein
MVKEWIRKFQTGLIGGYFGAITFLLIARIFADNWDLTIFMIMWVSFTVFVLIIVSDLFIRYLDKQK